MITLGLVALCFLIIYVLFDLLHLINTILVVIYSMTTAYLFPKDWWFHLENENYMNNVCLTTDLDLFMHMNNSRYLRDCDFARTKLWAQNNVLKALRSTGGSIVLGASAVRYRKPITLFTVYTIKSKVLYWDAKAFYVEQIFVRRSDGFVCCEVLAKQSLVGVTTDKILEALDYQGTKPKCPTKVAKWIEYNDLSSEQLRERKTR